MPESTVTRSPTLPTDRELVEFFTNPPATGIRISDWTMPGDMKHTYCLVIGVPRMGESMRKTEFTGESVRHCVLAYRMFMDEINGIEGRLEEAARLTGVPLDRVHHVRQ